MMKTPYHAADVTQARQLQVARLLLLLLLVVVPRQQH
jgi:hypothetical protein